MNCCGCNKEINTDKHEVPAKWYGRYTGDNQLLKVICDECIIIPEKKEIYCI